MKRTDRSSAGNSGRVVSNRSASLNALYTTTAVIELGTSLALLALPSPTVALLIGATPRTPPDLTLFRVAGAALLTIGAANWFARDDSRSLAAKGLAGAMVLYNLGVVLILSAAAIGPDLYGVALWPAVILHASMSVWCLVSLMRWEARSEFGSFR
jgi:hypothetical protein